MSLSTSAFVVMLVSSIVFGSVATVTELIVTYFAK